MQQESAPQAPMAVYTMNPPLDLGFIYDQIVAGMPLEMRNSHFARIQNPNLQTDLMQIDQGMNQYLQTMMQQPSVNGADLNLIRYQIMGVRSLLASINMSARASADGTHPLQEAEKARANPSASAPITE